MSQSRTLAVLALSTSLFIAPVCAHAQALPNIALARVIYASQKAAAKPEGDLKRAIDAIDQALSEALRAGRNGEARRLLAKGTTLLAGRPWNDVVEFRHSLVLRADRIFVDPSARPYTVRVEQIYAPALTLTSSLSAQVRVRQSTRPATAAAVARPGPIEKDYGTFAGMARDLRESPFFVDLDLTGVPDGRHVVEVEVLNGEQSLGTCTLPIETRSRLDARLAKLEEGAKSLPAASAALRADVLYPGDYVRKANRGRIEMGGFDADREVAAAEATLAAAPHKDPFAGRTGDFERHYLLEQAGEIMPYRLYVPQAYDGRRAFPLIVALHGLGADENSFFAAYGKRLPALAEEHGYLVVAPLGYRTDGAYGFALGLAADDTELRRKRETSEADVLAVLDLVRKQYRVDDSRIYLLGHSMGAIGSWYLAAKYPDRWAGLAVFAGMGAPATMARMKAIPQFVVHGDADTTVPVMGSRAMVAQMKQLGVEHQYIEVPGGTHMDVVEPNLKAALDFFDAHRRATSTSPPTPRSSERLPAQHATPSRTRRPSAAARPPA